MMNPVRLFRLAAALCLMIAGSAAAQSFSKTETITYHDNTALWVLGQTATVSCAAAVPASTACDGDVESATTYDSTYAMPVTTSAFGKLQSTLGYDTTSTVASGQRGTLKTVKDGNGNTTTVTNWKRGIPQKVAFPSGTGFPATSKSAVVDDNGWVMSITDELASKTCYSYDLGGRLSGVTYTSEAAANTCDDSPSAPWKPLIRSFVPVASAEFGIPAGHWRETVSTGNAVKITYYDAMWRPLLSREYDSADLAGTEHFVKTTYDTGGRVDFTSYPSTSSAPTIGVWTDYDALGRVISVSQDSELGPLTTTTSYDAGFKTTVTNPRHFATTTSYQTFDQPSTDAPVAIAAPETVSTNITRDPFGKPLTIARSGKYAGSAVSLTRRYVYDEFQQLCKTINPESGSTVLEYDGAGNVLWSADGLALASTVLCDRDMVLAEDKKTRTYDPKNRVKTVATPGGDSDLATTYYADGAINTLTAANPGGFNVVTSYAYNKRRLLTSETSTNGSTIYTLGYGYNANGSLASLAYPDGETVSYALDALGRAKQVTGTAQVYASGITYFPNGAIKGFTYGNGITHTLTQNLRQLPGNSLDKYGTQKTLDDTYVYDANGNVDLITDALPAGPTNRSRDLAYDGLDRLVTANAVNQWGAATYAYDPLDNLRIADQGARQYRYNYDAVTNRLLNIKNPAGVLQFGFTHDRSGNVLTKGASTYAFDASNRLSEVVGVQTYRYDGQGRRVQTTDADAKTTFWIYSQSGQVLYTSEARRSQNLSYIYLGNTQVATRAKAWSDGALTIRYQHTDALGSPVAETDSARAVAKRNSYAPYGEAYNSTIDGAGYTGHVVDQGTGLTYMQQRYYDPRVGRFLSIDSVATGSNSGENFNSYKYASNNPFRFTDPDGRQDRSYGASASLLLTPEQRRIWEGGERAATTEGNGALQGAAMMDAAKEFAADPHVSRESVAKLAVVLVVAKVKHGHYTNVHTSGTKYHGKGSEARMRASATEKAKTYGDPVVSQAHTPTETSREAFKGEARAIEADGGPGQGNYNKINSPGKKYLEEDRDKTP